MKFLHALIIGFPGTNSSWNQTSYLLTCSARLHYHRPGLAHSCYHGDSSPQSGLSQISASRDFTINIGLTSHKLQQRLSKQFLAEKNVLYNILKFLRNPMGESIEIEPNVTKLLPYMAITHNNGGVWSHNHTL